MKSKRRARWLIATAVGAGCWALLSGGALAQQRVGTDGRALDSNNRIGASGLNESGSRGPAHIAGNQIVTGNVTSGLEFRGPIRYTDPFAFRAPTAGIISDRFIRGSSGVPIQGVTQNNNAGVARPFYGESQTVERPPGFTLEAPGTGFVPAPRISREAGDLRLGRPLDAPITRLPAPGQLILPGPVDPNTQQPTVITASPLYGVRQWNFEEQADQQFLVGLNKPGRQRSRLDDRTLEIMRSELMQSEEEESQQTDRTSRRDPSGVRFDLRLDTPADAPRNDPLSSQVQDAPSNQPLSGDVRTNEKSGQRLMTAPERQSKQYAELRRRLQRYNRLPESMQELEAHRQYNEQLRAKQNAEEKEKDASAEKTATATPGPGAGSGTGAQTPGQVTTPGTTPQEQSPLEKIGIPDYAKRSKEILEGTTDTPSERTPIPGSIRDDQSSPKEQPLQITSLATGVQAKGLADFLREAEDLMKQGKFYSALDQYDLAEQVAPNNPMVPLGRAIAELGAGYYNRAEQHLRDAFTQDPALLMGQYDLKNFLGEERLDFLWTDLKAIANREAKEPRPVFLLAFIDYNTKNQNAAAYLDLAEKRAPAGDEFYSMLRKYWNLPQSRPVDDDNK